MVAFACTSIPPFSSYFPTSKGAELLQRTKEAEVLDLRSEGKNLPSFQTEVRRCSLKSGFISVSMHKSICWNPRKRASGIYSNPLPHPYSCSPQNTPESYLSPPWPVWFWYMQTQPPSGIAGFVHVAPKVQKAPETFSELCRYFYQGVCRS